MKIKSRTENCNFKQNFVLKGLADANVTLEIEMKTIASSQSKKQAITEIRNLIQGELSKFKWIISGHVQVDFVWYLNSRERQETDAIGDIDNISKPVLDALTGTNGIIIDDSLINGYYTSWGSKNLTIEMNILFIIIKFNNESTLQKKDLFFYQIDNAMYTPLNIRPDNIENILTIKCYLKHQRLIYKLNMPKLEWDFHRTRLNGFQANIISRQKLEKISYALNLQYKDVLDFFRNKVEN